MKSFVKESAFLAVILLISGCSLFENEQGLDIHWKDEDLNDYILYAYAPDGNSFAVIDLISGEIYRRLNDFDGIQSIAANEDGSLIYVSTSSFPTPSNPGYFGNIYQLNTDTWESEVIYDEASHLIEGHDGEIFFITKNSNSQRIFGQINSSTGAVNEIDSVDVNWGGHRDSRYIEIHPTKPLIFAVNSNYNLYKYNYETKEKTFLFDYISFRPFGSFVLSGGGDSLFIPSGPVLDLHEEKIVGTLDVWKLGLTQTRKDNKEVYITDPGGFFWPPKSSGNIQVYNPENDRVKTSITVNSPTDLIYLTPKERYIIVNNSLSKFIVVDLKKRKIVSEHQYIENNVQAQSIEGIYLAPKPPSLK